MIDYRQVAIQSINYGAQGNDEVYENLKVLYTTPVGSVAFDRNFGINTDFLDEPDPVAQGRLLIEYREKAKIYEPRASVQEVLFTSNQETGNLTPKVVIAIDLNN